MTRRISQSSRRAAIMQQSMQQAPALHRFGVCRRTLVIVIRLQFCIEANARNTPYCRSDSVGALGLLSTLRGQRDDLLAPFTEVGLVCRFFCLPRPAVAKTSCSKRFKARLLTTFPTSTSD